jgi:glyoxylase-like metal-dependent hydrolase (beta-lactamase superfamily II)
MHPVFVTNKLSDTVFGIVEDDPFRENPIMYVVFGDDTAALIDAGCATGDLLHYLRNNFLEYIDDGQKNLVNNRLLVINTHNHYDHVASNWRFSHPKKGLHEGVLDLCASSKDRAYTEDRFNTLSWYSGCAVRPYKITRWLNEGEIIHLANNGGSRGNEEQSLEIIHTPGHTPDSMCLFYPRDRRLFVGDVIYR